MSIHQRLEQLLVAAALTSDDALKKQILDQHRALLPFLSLLAGRLYNRISESVQKKIYQANDLPSK